MSNAKAARALIETAEGFAAILAKLDIVHTINTSDLDAIIETGFYDFSTSAVGNPDDTYDGRLIHMQEPNGEASQIAILGTKGLWFRDQDYPIGHENYGWGDWVSIYVPTVRKNIGHGDQVFNSAWLLAANLFGDTAVTGGNYDLTTVRIRDIVHISGYVELNDFNATIPTDTSWSATLDLGAIAATSGAFVNIESGGFIHAFVEFDGPSIDTAGQPCRALISNKSASSANSLSMSANQTYLSGYNNGADTAITQIILRFSGTFQVSD